MPKLQDLIIGVVGLAGSGAVHLLMIVLLILMCPITWFFLSLHSAETTATIAATEMPPVVTTTPEAALGTVSTDSVVIISAHRGDRIENVVAAHSLNAQIWGVLGYPCTALKGVHFEPSSGGLPPGTDSYVWIEIDQDATAGFCEGEITIRFESERTEDHPVKFQLTVLP